MALKRNGHHRNRLLAALQPEVFLLLHRFLKEVPLCRGDLLHRPDAEIEYVYFLHGGMVSLMAVMENGNSIETASVGREGAIGTIAGFNSLFAFTRALVQVPGTASRITSSSLRKIVRESDAISGFLTRYHMGLMAHVQQASACNSLHDATARLGRLLLLARDHNGNDVIPLTQENLGQMLGLSRTTVTSAARALQKSGFVHYYRGEITILDRPALKHGACECYGTICRAIAQVTK